MCPQTAPSSHEFCKCHTKYQLALVLLSLGVFFFPRRTALGGVYLAGRPPSCCMCLKSLCLLFSSSTTRNLTKDKTEAACGRHADGDLWQNLASGPSYQITYGGDFLCLQQKFDATLTALGAELWRRLREEITTSGPYIKTSI